MISPRISAGALINSHACANGKGRKTRETEGRKEGKKERKTRERNSARSILIIRDGCTRSGGEGKNNNTGWNTKGSRRGTVAFQRAIGTLVFFFLGPRFNSFTSFHTPNSLCTRYIFSPVYPRASDTSCGTRCGNTWLLPRWS